VILPRVLARTKTGEGARLTLAMDADLRWFAGHFPEHPVLPGAVQVGWAVAFAREVFGFETDAPALDQIKFQRPILPGETVELELKRLGPAGRIGYRLAVGGEPAGSGRLDFGAGRKP
jgi:3-hydroxymyristoyl/3-hydroxydecanoyl-(acyl carrier protein) dehydratase